MKPLTGKCTYCHTFRIAASGKARRFRLCRGCASDREIIAGRIKAEKVTKEISAGLPKLYRELRNEAKNER